MEKRIAEKSARKTAGNAVFAVLSQMLLTLTPLITTPFVSRELGAANLGVFVHTLVMVQYFQMFANLGVVNYGTRTLAEDGSDVQKISAHFWQIYGMQVLNTCIFFAAYLIYILILPSDSKLMAVIQIMWLVGAFFDVNWFFYGIEEIKVTALKDVIVKVLTIAGILLFVRKGSHPLIVYTVIMGAGNLLGLMFLIPMLRKYIVWVKPSFSQMFQHLKPTLVLFVPILATSVFHSMDKTMLGYMTSYEELGYYYNADKIINVPLQITNALATVFLPKASALLSSDDRKAASGFLAVSFEVTIVLSCALAFGIAGCAKDFVPVFFGAGFESCILLIYLFVPVLIIKSVSAFFRMEYLVPMHQERLYITATFAGAVVNLIFNAILIPKFGAAGAVIGTLLAELAVMLVQLYGMDDIIPLGKMIRALISYLIIAAVMFVMMKLAGMLGMSVLLRVVAEVGIGALVYIVICLVYWNSVGEKKEIRDVLLGLLRRKQK